MADQFRHDALFHVGAYGRISALDAMAKENEFSACDHRLSAMHTCAFRACFRLISASDGDLDQRGNRAVSHRVDMDPVSRRGRLPNKSVRQDHFHESAHLSGDLRDGMDLMRGYGLMDVDEISGPHASVAVQCAMTNSWRVAGLLDAFRQDVKQKYAEMPWIARPSPLGLDHYYDTYVGRRALEYLSSYDRPEPWFCWISFAGPHEPWDAPPPYDQMHRPSDMPIAIPRASDWSGIRGIVA